MKFFFFSVVLSTQTMVSENLMKCLFFFLFIFLVLHSLHIFSELILFFLTSLLEYNCFTVVCQFLLYNKVNQIYIYIYPHISFLLHLPPTLPIPPLQVVTKHRANLPVLCGQNSFLSHSSMKSMQVNKLRGLGFLLFYCILGSSYPQPHMLSERQ